ncbi:Brp/Blh family beta-carotene 15,15'-dioxygenase [Aureitalea sp. L0-47]|uniref:Brp/Blh family beta-carotene 15,15'-dioxygenase n=1 Tax=Aureitalea sp. L0-47 TaxID=2816962 RepID=UPI002237D87F|nr:Brp/Blh family beta-carotene 15,15'-dioxygenase [Aureitalea sp. L0-47]MCW5520648.1 Brp/Blh family beta-carotene 15,15'-dioxygenase [Aureitalea sp. L0-47]
MNFKKVAVFITLFSLWLTNYFSGSEQELVAFFLIFSVGILHGSNDLAIMSKLRSVSGLRRLIIVLGSYILVVLIAGAFFYWLPELALAGFILFSAYHFGEQHWESLETLQPKGFRGLFFAGYGLLILFLLFYTNMGATQEIISSLSGQIIPESWFVYGLLSSLVLTVIAVFYLLVKKQIDYGRVAFECFLLLVFGIVFRYADLIWAFAIYFIYWHSIPSIFGQLKYLYGEVSLPSFKLYLKSSSIIWAISVGSMLMLFYIFKDNQEIIMPLFFAFLGAITFAHSFIITRMYGQKKPNE